jgi:chromosome segregation ATPase
MAERKPVTKKLSTTNTKQEMLDAYNDLLVQIEEKRETAATPEQKVTEKAIKQVVAVADELTADTIIRDLGGLKGEVGKVLTTLSDRLEQESGRYQSVKKAITEKEKELAEIYEIQRAASSLSALIEAQNLKKEEFEADMAARKEALSREVEEMRTEWQKEKSMRAAEIKEQEVLDSKKRDREKEEFEYILQRERQAAKDLFEKEKNGFAEEKERLEREIALRREQNDREFAEREQAFSRQEQELADLRAKVTAFPKELEATVSREVKVAVSAVQTEAKYKLDLLQMEFEGERNVLSSKIASLEALVKDQSARIAMLTDQVEKSYSQVQAIAVKAVEGSAAKVSSVVQPQQRQQGE